LSGVAIVTADPSHQKT